MIVAQDEDSIATDSDLTSSAETSNKTEKQAKKEEELEAWINDWKLTQEYKNLRPNL